MEEGGGFGKGVRVSFLRHADTAKLDVEDSVLGKGSSSPDLRLVPLTPCVELNLRAGQQRPRRRQILREGPPMLSAETGIPFPSSWPNGRWEKTLHIKVVLGGVTLRER